MPPRRSFPYPTQFQVTFCIRRLRRPDAYLPSGTLASERNLEILKHYQAGYTLFQLAEMFKLSYQRVHQIIMRERRNRSS
jgi:Mor family transcriptional regulator